MNIVVLEDQQCWLDMMKNFLTSLGHTVLPFSLKHEALSHAALSSTDIFIADASLPDGCIFDSISTIRQANPHAGIIIITANSDITKYTQGMNDGADYYLIKPISLQVLEATVNALTRRMRNILYNASSKYTWTLDYVNSTLTDKEFSISLTAKEAIIMKLLINSLHFPTSHTCIENHLNYSSSIDNQHRIDVLIYRLRKKLSSLSNSPFNIRNIYGEGFLLTVKAPYKVSIGVT